MNVDFDVTRYNHSLPDVNQINGGHRIQLRFLQSESTSGDDCQWALFDLTIRENRQSTCDQFSIE